MFKLNAIQNIGGYAIGDWGPASPSQERDYSCFLNVIMNKPKLSAAHRYASFAANGVCCNTLHAHVHTPSCSTIDLCQEPLNLILYRAKQPLMAELTSTANNNTGMPPINQVELITSSVDNSDFQMLICDILKENRNIIPYVFYYATAPPNKAILPMAPSPQSQLPAPVFEFWSTINALMKSENVNDDASA